MQIESGGERKHGNYENVHKLLYLTNSILNHVEEPTDRWVGRHVVDDFKPHDEDGEALDSPEVRLDRTFLKQSCNGDIEQAHDVEAVNDIPESTRAKEVVFELILNRSSLISSNTCKLNDL